MCRRMSCVICVVLVMALANTAAAKVYLEFDCGICDLAWVQPGWISIPRCGVYEDVGGTPVDVNVATGGNDCGCRGYFDENTSDPPCYDPCPPVGPLAGVEQDFLMNDDCGPDSPCGDVILTFSELDAGAPYTVTSYHNRLDQLTSYISGVVVTGATDVTAPASIGQQHSMFLESGSPPQVTFTAGAGDVVVRYVHPTADCGSKGCQVFMNGFILDGGNTEAYFESASGSALENSGPVSVWVNLSDPAEETLYVYFARTGGTATIGSDYTLPASPLVFNAGQISKAIQINVMNDGADEQDETFELTLTSVTGTNVVLGETTVHTHTILDPRPAVGFAEARSMLQETDAPVEVTVTLSEAAGGTVTVQYAATSGSASNGIDYYLEPNTLTFEAGQTSKTFTIEPYTDTREEVAETIVVTLSDATGAKWGLTQHTCTLFDPWTDVSFPKFKVDLGCPTDPNRTVKEGWTPWVIPEGCNGQPNYGTGISDIAGTNIDAYISPEGDTGNGNLRLSAYGEAICNTSYGRYSGSDQEVAVVLTFSGAGLTAGEYWLYSYHNAAGLGTISSITATGPAVIQKEPVVDIPIQEITSDYDLVPSLVRFLTDGSAAVTITYHAGTASNAVVNAFELRTTARPLTASNPDPFDGALDVDPNVVLGWENGKLALSHNVYLGTDFNSVNDATTSSPEFVENRPLASNWYDPPDLLEFGVDYYWRIDEVKGATTYKGEVWFFSTDDGKARHPVPMDGGRALFDQALLSWDAAPHASWHDVYFGTDFTDVNDATSTDTRDVYKNRNDLVDNSYAPGTLQIDVTYFWRIDEVGTATFHKGDVWSFSTAGRIDLKVDFALALCDANDYSEHWPESAKPGWHIWAQPRWHDMYGHDAVLNDGSGFERSLGADFMSTRDEEA
ncbi:MAG: Calx-beta domain-containing protein [Planctomycetota bacterium]